MLLLPISRDIFLGDSIGLNLQMRRFGTVSLPKIARNINTSAGTQQLMTEKRKLEKSTLQYRKIYKTHYTAICEDSRTLTQI